jgi:hypothetical protein
MSELVRTILLPNSFFYVAWGDTYLCARCWGSHPDYPIEAELPFFADVPFVSFSEGELWVNHQPYNFKPSNQPIPDLPLYISPETHTLEVKVDRLEHLVVENGVLTINNHAERIFDFPVPKFEASDVQIAHVNELLARGFKGVGLTYAWYRPIIFISIDRPWMTYYLRAL